MMESETLTKQTNGFWEKNVNSKKRKIQLILLRQRLKSVFIVKWTRRSRVGTHVDVWWLIFYTLKVLLASLQDNDRLSRNKD